MQLKIIIHYTIYCSSGIFCLTRDLLKHKDSFDAGLRKRINKRVAEIEAEKHAEREREEMEAAERKRAAEEYAKRKAAELEPTVKWTPENARKGGMRFYAFYKRSEEHTSELQSPDHLVC